MAADSPRFRLTSLGVVVLSLFGALFARAWYLQVLDSTTFVAAATSNQVRLVFQEAPRGRILDRNGKVLVDNSRSQVIAVRKAELSRLRPAMQQEVKARLAALLNLSPEDLQRRIDDVRYSQYKPVPVAEDVDEGTFIYVKEHQVDFPSVEALVISRRSYPNGTIAAHVLGYVGEINDTELRDNRAAGYRLGDTIGKSGVELVNEHDLRGTPGVQKLQVNSAGDVLGDPLAVQVPVPGHDVQLTLDLNVQRLAEDSLLQGLEAARQAVDKQDKRHFVAPAGSVVVLDPRDGSVLAMASYPTYQPGDFVNGIKPDVYRALTDPAAQKPLTNRVTSELYAPGSTFKLVTATAAAERGLIQANTSITDTGTYTVPNCKGEKCSFKNAGGRANGRVDLRRAITVSSDVYFYGLGAQFWLQRSRFPTPTPLQDTAHAYGFGTRSGIPLPGDKAGLISDPDMRKKLFDKYPGKFLERNWFTGDSINMAIGQGDVSVTPLQLANAYATFANGGTRFEPRIAARVLDDQGASLRDEQPKPAGKVDLPPNVRDPILQGLRGVVDSPEGTASSAFGGFPRGFPVAAKTGTAQVRDKQDTAVFAAFAPADNPQYALSVVLEESGFGGSAAAPVARRILEGIAGAPPGPIHLGTGAD
jgi:penicillin-binding protein 2